MSGVFCNMQFATAPAVNFSINKGQIPGYFDIDAGIHFSICIKTTKETRAQLRAVLDLLDATEVANAHVQPA